MKLQKLGGYASIIMLCVFAAAISLGAITLPRLGIPLMSNSAVDPAKIMAAFEASPVTFRLFQPVGVLLAIFYVVVTLALQERMQTKAPNLMRFAVISAAIASALQLASTIIGVPALASIATAKDLSAYKAVTGITGGLSAAAGHAWGWGLLLLAWAAIRTRALPQLLGYVILVCGVVQITQFATKSSILSGVNALLAVVILLWLGIVLIRKAEPATAETMAVQAG